MARLFVFGLLAVVFGLAGAEEGCDKNQFFTVFWEKCDDLPGTPATNNACPEYNMPYMYNGNKYCTPADSVVPAKCDSPSFFNPVLLKCDTLPGIPQVNNVCPNEYIKVSYIGQDRCQMVMRGPAGGAPCAAGQVVDLGKSRCITAPGVTAVGNKCSAHDVKYTHYDGVTRCLAMPHV